MENTPDRLTFKQIGLVPDGAEDSRLVEQAMGDPYLALLLLTHREELSRMTQDEIRAFGKNDPSNPDSLIGKLQVEIETRQRQLRASQPGPPQPEE